MLIAGSSDSSSSSDFVFPANDSMAMLTSHSSDGEVHHMFADSSADNTPSPHRFYENSTSVTSRRIEASSDGDVDVGDIDAINAAIDELNSHSNSQQQEDFRVFDGEDEFDDEMRLQTALALSLLSDGSGRSGANDEELVYERHVSDYESPPSRLLLSLLH